MNLYSIRWHRANRPVDSTPTQARCVATEETPWCWSSVCPRHYPADYADMMARHATDSIRADRFHNFGATR